MKPANFLDIGGGASAEVMANGLSVILGDPQVKSVFVNVFGGITSCDAVANGIVGRSRRSAPRRSSRWSCGSTATRWRRAARFSPTPNHPLVTLALTMDEGADKAAELADRSRSKEPKRNVDLPQQELQGHRPGHHGRRGHQAHRAHAQGGHPGRRRCERAQGGRDRNARRSRWETCTLPVFGTVDEAIRETGADVSIVFVPPAFAKDAVVEAIEAEIPMVVVITEGIPVQDSAEFWACPGQGQPDPHHRTELPRHHHARASRSSGITPANITGKGPIGLVSKSGTLTYQMMFELRDLGFSTAIGIGGDPIIGTTHIDALAAFEADPETKAIVMIGEIGGDAEERAADFIKANVTKPVVAYVAGIHRAGGQDDGPRGRDRVIRSQAPRRARRKRSRPPASRSARRRAETADPDARALSRRCNSTSESSPGASLGSTRG